MREVDFLNLHQVVVKLFDIDDDEEEEGIQVRLPSQKNTFVKRLLRVSASAS
jgi:hypothetical protein